VNPFFKIIVGLTGVTLVVLSFSWSLAEGPQSGDVATGQLTFNNACRTCHSVKEGDNRLGPSLYNVFGRKAGSLPAYPYSTAMKDAEFVWDKEKLDRFISDPDAVVPGNKMKPYGGLASPDARANVIAFLASLTTNQ
jgi:cytochrome c